MKADMRHIVIRPYRDDDSKDKEAILVLHGKAEWENIGQKMTKYLITELSAQLIVVVAAVLFIVFGVPLYLCWVSIPAVLGLVILFYMAGRTRDFKRNMADLSDLERIYLEDEKGGFWVAEEWRHQKDEHPVMDMKKIIFRSQLEMESLALSGGMGIPQKKIVGTVGIAVKEDRDMKEPPRSVGVLGHLLVAPALRHLGVAQALVTHVWDLYCINQFRAVELLVGEHQESARRFFENQDWPMTSVLETRNYLGLIRGEWMVFRKPCLRGLNS